MSHNKTNLTWSLDTETGELVISGTCEMTAYSSISSVPWYSYRSSINFVTIDDGAGFLLLFYPS